MVKICTVCGEAADFEGFSENLRESGNCTRCGSFNRQRQMAFVLRQRLGVPVDGALALRDAVTLYNLESNGPLHARLANFGGYVCSEYFGPEYVSGKMVATSSGKVRHEDVQALSFPPDTFDFVMSSDVLEHVPDPYQAHREIYRVLKPGGSHIFTVPYNPGAARDDKRAELVDGKVHYLAEALYHGDPVRPDEGILVWNIFGQEMLECLCTIGFEVDDLKLQAAEFGILGDNAIVFVARKVGAVSAEKSTGGLLSNLVRWLRPRRR